MISIMPTRRCQFDTWTILTVKISQEVVAIIHRYVLKGTKVNGGLVK